MCSGRVWDSRFSSKEHKAEAAAAWSQADDTLPPNKSEAARAQSYRGNTGQLHLDGTGIKEKGGGNLPR